MEYLLKSAAIIILFYVCYKLFLEKDTHFVSNRFFLMSGIALAFIIPFIVIPVYVVREPLGMNVFAIATGNQQVTNSNDFQLSLMDFLAPVYFIGVLVMLIKSGIEFASLFKILKNCKKQSGEHYTFLQTNEKVSPFSFFNAIVYNPELFDKNELKHIIAHEKAHANQLHSFDVLLVNLAGVFLWFNPFVWLYKKEIKQNLEFIADRTAQNQSNCSKTYQRLLLKTSVNNTQLVLANNFYNSLIKKRIVMLHKNPSNKNKQWKLLLVAPLLAAFMLTFNTKVIAQSKEKSNDKKVETAQVEVVQFVITKNSNDQDLNELKAKLKDQGVTASFKKIKRNSENEITGISINASGKNSSANFALNNETPISDIAINYNKSNDNISIGNTKNLHFASGKKMTWVTSDSGDDKDIEIEIEGDDSTEGSYSFVTTDGKKHKIHKKVKVVEIEGDDDGIIELNKNDGNVYVVKKEVHVNDDGEKEVKMIVKTDSDKDHVWIDKDEDEIHINGGEKKIVFIDSDQSNPLILIDGKESTKEDMKKLEASDKIETIEIFKGDKAVEDYGQKAKDGVIKITSKK